MTRTGSYLSWVLGRYLIPELRAWRGEMPLAAVFWGYGVFVSGELVVLYAIALYLVQLLVQQALIVVIALYTPWILVVIWRCADNAATFWSTMAKWLTVGWGLNTMFVLLFLQFDLLVRYGDG